MVTADELIATAQALTRNLRHLDGLLAEIATAPTTIGHDGDVYVRLDPAVFAAIRRRINEDPQ